MKAIALLVLVIAVLANAQQTVYLCNGTYTDKPCKDGREVDVRPTEGAHSISGKRMQSYDAQMREMNQAMAENLAKGTAQYKVITLCDQLRRERELIDRSGAASVDSERRFAIRQQQFRLNCRSQ